MSEATLGLEVMRLKRLVADQANELQQDKRLIIGLDTAQT